MAKAAAPAAHRWRFYRAGGVDQVRLDSGGDIFHLRDLDQKLWVALSCPVKGLEFDERTLALLDADGDDHVRPPEILAAIDWLKLVLKSADGLARGEDGVPLASIRGDTPEGKAVLLSAKHVLKSLGRAEATAVTVGDAVDAVEALRTARYNGDGVVPADTIDDEALRALAEEVIACVGGVEDRSGRPGISAEKVAEFFAACEAFAAWSAKAVQDAKTILPLGDATAAAAAALEAVRAKVDDFFARCRLAEFDPRALNALNREEGAYLELAAKDLTIDAREVAGFPLAAVGPGKALPLVEGVNPAWRAGLTALRELCVAPLLGRNLDALGEAQWRELDGRFAGFRAWQADRAGTAVEGLGADRVRAILAGPGRAGLEQAIANDLLVAGEVDALTDVEKLTRLHRDLVTLLNNYVSFRDFYDLERTAIFQSGTLFLDGRSTEFCVEVGDPGKHGTLAAMAKTFLAYVDCTRPGGLRKTVACALTAGDSDNLFVGRNGIYYDRKGLDWDATVTKIIDQPISIGQAFWSPYKKLLRWVEEQVAKRAAAADESAATKLQGAASAAGDAAATGKGPAEKPKFDVGVVAALGVAVGGITAALGALLDSFFGLGFWMPLGVLGLVLLISGPSMVIAWLKLRQRNLGPILDANGWAVNTLTKINLPLGRMLTDTAVLPKGAERSLKDPYAPRKPLWPKLLFALLILGGLGYGAWRLGYLHEHLTFLPAPPKAGAQEAGAGTGGAPPVDEGKK
jgi:hypothetical protein